MSSYKFIGDSPFNRMGLFKAHLDAVAEDMPTVHPAVKNQQRWDPYVVQGGTTAALAGPDYVIVAGDTRMSQHDVNIMTRQCDKIHPLTSKIVMSTCGFQGDVLQMKRLLKMRIEHYRFVYQHEMSVDLCAEMVSRSLYYHRFFPYYTGISISGITEDGEGAIYKYDAIGTLERVTSTASGPGEPIIQTFFDSQFDKATFAPALKDEEPMPLEQAKKLMRDAFQMVVERETSTGDSMKLIWLQCCDDEVHEEVVSLRED